MYESAYARKLFRDIFLKGNNPSSRAPVRDFEAQLMGIHKKKSTQILAQISGRGICMGRGLEQVTKELKLPVQGFKYFPFVAVECDSREVKDVCAHLKKRLPWISYVSEARVLYIPELLPGMGGFPVSQKLERRWGEAWNLELIGSDVANKKTKGEGIKVGIIDTGVDYTHKEVEKRFGKVKGYNFVDNTEDPFDGNGHGTHVAGIVAGNDVGVAPSCNLYAIKVLSDGGYGSEADVLRGIEWAIDNKLDVINMSLGSSQYSYFEDQVIQEAHKRGIVIAAAAGNEYYGPSYPAALENVIAVAAVDQNKEHAEFSNIYRTNDISAPGVKIYSSVPGGYQEFSGTSMATPHIAGCMALACSLYKKNPEELERLMKETAEALGSSSDPDNEEKYGAGLVRADELVESLSEKAWKNAPIQEVRFV